MLNVKMQQLSNKHFVVLVLFALGCIGVNAQTISGNVFGGGRMANVDGKATVVVNACDAVESVYGANDISGNVGGGTDVTVNGGLIKENVFGGANGYYGCNDDGTYKYTNDFGLLSDGTSPDTNVSTFNGGLTIPTVNVTSVSITGGEILGSVYAGGNLAYVGEKIDASINFATSENSGVASLSVTKGHIHGNVFAGGNMASIFGKTNLIVNGDYSLKIDGGVYGGNDKMGTISGGGATDITASNGDEVAAGTCYVKIQGTPIIGQVFGGGNGDYDYTTAYTDNEDFPYDCLLTKANNEKPIQANSYVDIVTTGGRIAQAFAGGNGVSVSTSATIVLNGSNTTSLDTVTVGQMFGGNNVAEMTIVPTIKLVKGHANEVYGGGNAGNMTGSKTINSVDYGTVIEMTSANDVKVNTVYGGCNMANVIKNTLITLNSSKTIVETIYGGCNISGSVPESYVTLTAGTVTNRVFGGANGAYGCNDGEKYTSDYDATDGVTVTTDMTIPTITNTHVVVNGATMTNASVYGGGNMAPVSGSTDVNLTSGTLGSAFGGGNKATVTGVANIYTPSGSDIKVTNIFGGNDNAGTVKGTGRTGESLRGTALDADNAATYVKIEGAPKVTNIYGGGNGAYNYNDEDMFKCGESAPDQDGAWVDINTTSTSIGTVYGGSKAANINGTATVDLLQLSSPNSNIFGGNDIAGTVAESVVNMDENTTTDKVIVKNIYGGGNGHYEYAKLSGVDVVFNYGETTRDAAHVVAYSATAPLTTTTNVNLADGQVKACAYGGGMAGDVVTTNVVVEKDAVIDSTLFGGGCGDLSHIGACGPKTHVGNVTGSANLTINSYNKPVGKVYGGGRAGDVAFANITIPDPDTAAGAVINFAELYGGCYGSDLTQTATITIGEDTAFADTKINIGTVYGGNDYAGLCQNTVLTINNGTYSHVYGAGNGVYDYGMTTWVMDKEQTCNIVPYSMNVEITFNGGHYLDHVYGGGNMGLVGNKYMTTANHPEGSVNNNMYGYIHMTIHDGMFENRVLGGACGTAIGTKRFFGLNAYGTSTNVAENARNNSTVLAYAYKQVDMDGGEIHFSLHGGSEGVDDGHPYECWDSIYNSDGKLTATTLRPSSMVNITGGTINKSVYGGGYEGNTFGSICVNVGRDAIRKCPAWNAVLYREGAPEDTRLQLEYDTKFQAFASAAKYGLKTGLEGHDLYLLASVYNGSDWGQGSSTQTQYFNTRGFYGGKGLVYIDGKGYQTSLTRMSTDPQMNIVSSVFGSGTSTAEADVNSQIWIHNYGDWSCPTPSRQLHSVQRANYLELYKSNITLLGESDAFASHSTNTRSLNRLDTVYFVKNNVIEADAPMEFIGLMASIDNYPKISGIDGITYYDAQAMNDKMVQGCTDISTNPCNILTNDVTSMNVVVVNNGSYITVQPFTPEEGSPTTHDVAAAYGPVLGYFYLLPQQSTQISVTARQKKSETASADDGGFVSPCSSGNTFPSAPPYEVAYVDMTVASTGEAVDHRSWKLGTPNSSRKRAVTIAAHADPSKVVEDEALGMFYFGTASTNPADTTHYNNFAYAKTTVTLPPSDAGHYYTIMSVAIDDDNNGQIELVDYVYNPLAEIGTGVNADSAHWWNPYEQKLTSESDADFTDRKYKEKKTAVELIENDPSYTFGMMFDMNNYFSTTQWSWNGGTTESPVTYYSKDASVVSGNANLTSASGFTSNKIVAGAEGVLPTMDFYLTYNTQFATTVNRNVRMTMMEYDDAGHEVGPVEITVTISTIISDFNDIEAPLLAMYNAGTYNEYVRKVMIPASFEERELYVEGVEWKWYEEVPSTETYFHVEKALGATLTEDGTYSTIIPTDYKNFGIVVTPTQDVAEDISNTLGWYDISAEPAKGMDIHQLAGETDPKNFHSNSLDPSYYTEEQIYKIGVLDGRAAAALDVKLVFNGNLVYQREDICGIAKVHMVSYPTKVDGVENTHDEEYAQHFDLIIRVRTRMSGDTIYMAEPKNFWIYSDGSYTYLDDTPLNTAKYYHVTRSGAVDSSETMSEVTPTAADVYQISTLYRYDDVASLKARYQKNDPVIYLNSFENVFKIYDEGDVIDIMGPIHISNSEKPLTVSSAAYSHIDIIRYSGSHVRWPGELYTYRGPMIVVEKGAKLTLSGIYIDGSGCTRTEQAVDTLLPSNANASHFFSETGEATPQGIRVPVISNASDARTSFSVVEIDNGHYKRYTNRKTIEDTLFANAPAILVRDNSYLYLNSNNKLMNCFSNVDMSHLPTTLPTDPMHKENYHYGAALGLEKTAAGVPQVVIGDKNTFSGNMILANTTGNPGNYGAGIYSNGGVITMGRLKENNTIQIKANYVVDENALSVSSGVTATGNNQMTLTLRNQTMTLPDGAWTYPVYTLRSQATANALGEKEIHNSNVFLTRVEAATVADETTVGHHDASAKEKVIYDAQSDLIHVNYKLGSTSRIGVSKWFPGYVDRDTYGRDTIGIVDYSLAGSLAASNNAKSKVFMDDSVAQNNSHYNAYRDYNIDNTVEDVVDVRYSNLLNPYKIYLHRCATFQKRDLDNDATNGIQYLTYNMNPDVVCPGDGDQISFGVTGGSSAYTYNWYTKGTSGWGTPVTIVSNDTMGTYTPLNLHLATDESAKTFNLKVEAVESGGCKQEHYFDILVKQTGADDAAGDAASTDISEGLFVDSDPDYVQNAGIDTWMGYTSQHNYNVPGVDTVVAATNTETTADKIARMYTYSKLNMLVSPATFTDYLEPTPDPIATYTDKSITDAGGHDATSLRLCPGDLVNLSVTPHADYEFVSWDFDPSAPQTTELVVTKPEQTVVAYLAPNAYWYKKINTFGKATEHAEGVQPGYEIDYHGSITIRNERGLAWLISTANGLNGQHAQTFIFDTITIMPKEGGYDMSAYKWTPIGSNRMPFRGVLVAGEDPDPAHGEWTADIKGVTVNESELLYVGMFGITDSARISGLTLTNSSIHGNAYAGGLIGYANNNTEIKTITMDGSNVVSGGSSVGGIAGKGTGVTIDSNKVNTRINGNALYVGAVCGEFTTVESGTTTTDDVVESYISNNDVTVNINQASALSAGGMAGASVGTNTAVASDPFSAGRKSTARSSIHISNNRVKMGGSPNSFYVGGLIGNATNTDMENNFVYGSLSSLSVNGGLVAVVGSNVNMENCFYAEDDIDNEYGLGAPSVSDNVSTFSGEGNQVLLSDTIGGTNNLTRVLNNWVREASREYRTWRSDLEGLNDGYPYFGDPDMIPVRDTISDVVCDSYDFNGQTITESGVYSMLISDSTLYIDSTITIMLTVHHAQSISLNDSVEVGSGYYSNGFYLSAEDIQSMMAGDPMADVHVLQLVDSLLTENGCDSVITLNLVVYNSQVGVDDVDVQFNINVYPNPTLGVVNVDADGLISVEVYDAMSRMVQSIEAKTDHCVFDLSKNPAGSYYLRIRTEHGTAVKKVVKR